MYLTSPTQVVVMAGYARYYRVVSRYPTKVIAAVGFTAGGFFLVASPTEVVVKAEWTPSNFPVHSSSSPLTHTFVFRKIIVATLRPQGGMSPPFEKCISQSFENFLANM